MIRAVSKGWFSGDYVIQRDGLTIGDLKLSRSTIARLVGGAPVVVFDLEGLDYDLSAEVASTVLPVLGKLNRLVLKQDGSEIAWAEPSSLNHLFTVHSAGRHVDLIGRLWTWQRTIRLMERGAESGIIYRGYFSKRTDFELLGEVALDVQIFMLWLALWRWKSTPDSGD